MFLTPGKAMSMQELLWMSKIPECTGNNEDRVWHVLGH